MGNWSEGDICEIHDSPDECDEECEMDNSDEDGEWDIYPYNAQKH